MKITKIISLDGMDYFESGSHSGTSMVMCARFTEFWFGSSWPQKIQVTISTEQFKNKAKQLRVSFRRGFDEYSTGRHKNNYVYHRTREILCEKFGNLKNRTFWVQMRKVK